MRHVHGDKATEVDSGAYQLIASLGKRKTVRVGALGQFSFEPGVYVYTGRASRNLGARIRRHLSDEKKLRWHIDYLLQWLQVDRIHVHPGRAHDECIINLATFEALGGVFPVRGFGSSDCTCPSHLVRLDPGVSVADLIKSAGPGARVIRP